MYNNWRGDSGSFSETYFWNRAMYWFYDLGLINITLTFSCILLKNGHTYVKNLAVFSSVFGHFSKLCLKGPLYWLGRKQFKLLLKILFHFESDYDLRKVGNGHWIEKLHQFLANVCSLLDCNNYSSSDDALLKRTKNRFLNKSIMVQSTRSSVVALVIKTV